MKSIAFIVKTSGLEFDDRVRKEALTLKMLGYNVKIFVQLNSNIKSKGTTSYGVKYESIKLKTRDYLPSSRLLVIKSFEFFLAVKKKLKGFEYVWCHEEYTFIFPLLLSRNNVIWDLHELPVRFNSYIMTFIFKVIEKKCIAIIHANEYRLEYLENLGYIKYSNKNFVINNYPDSIFLDSKFEVEANQQFKLWVDNSNYIYLQGLSTKKRLPYNTLKAVLTSGCKAVVVGSVEAGLRKKLQQEFGKSFVDQHIFFTGMIEQMAIRSLLEHAEFTIVLYDKSTANNQFCEANRLYQSILSGVPVIVGANPSMAQVVNDYKCGIVLPDYGEGMDSLLSAIAEMKINSDSYIVNSASLDQLTWSDKQVSSIMNYAESRK